MTPISLSSLTLRVSSARRRRSVRVLPVSPSSRDAINNMVKKPETSPLVWSSAGKSDGFSPSPTEDWDIFRSFRGAFTFDCHRGARRG